MSPELALKQVELLRQVVPGLARLGVLANPTNPGTPLFLANVNEAARGFNISVVVAEVTRAEEFDKASGPAPGRAPRCTARHDRTHDRPESGTSARFRRNRTDCLQATMWAEILCGKAD
jgi:ABC-type uncharacterized transport system substrate-binding protein